VEFRVRFVASQVKPVILDAAEGTTLLKALEARFDEDDLGIPDLVGRLREGVANGDEMTVDETQADELLIALRTVKVAEPDTFSDRLAALEAACLNYRRQGLNRDSPSGPVR
jgi:hypothetical protein